MLASMSQADQSVMPVHFRWATEAEEQPVKSAGSKRALAQGQGPSKRAKAQGAVAETDDFDGLTAGLDGFFGKKQGRRGMHDNAKPTRGVLKQVMPMHLPGLEHMTFDKSCLALGYRTGQAVHISAPLLCHSYTRWNVCICLCL